MKSSKKTTGTIAQEPIEIDSKYIDSLQINSETWTCQVSLIVEYNSSHIPYLDSFNKFAATNGSQLVRNISLPELWKKIQQNASEYQKVQKTKHELNKIVETYLTVCAKTWKLWSKDPQNIPLDLLAKIIKLEILDIKEKQIDDTYQQRRLINVPQSMQDSNKVSCHNLLGSKKPLVVEISENSSDTENESDNMIEEASPIGGANLYITLSNFYIPDLIVELIKNGAPLVALIQMRRDMSEQLDDITEQQIPKNPKSASSKKSAKNSYITNRVNYILKFWLGYTQKLSNTPEYYETLKDLAFFVYKTPIFDFQNTKTQHIIEYGRIIYDSISAILYDINDLRRQHINFLGHMKEIDVGKSNSDEFQLENMNIYHGMLKLIPSECLTIPVILTCMLEQVEAMVPNRSQKNKPNLSCKRKFLSIFRRIAKQHVKEFPQFIDEFSHITNPIVIKFGNTVKLRTFHVPHLHLNQVTAAILSKHIIPTIWNSIPKITGEQSVLFSNYLSRLKFKLPVKSVSKKSLWNDFRLKVFEKMICPSSKLHNPPPIYNQMPRTNAFAQAGDLGQTRISSTGPNIQLNCCSKSCGLVTNSPNSTIEFTDILQSNDLMNLIFRKDPSTICTDDINMVNYYDPMITLQRIFEYSRAYHCIDYHHCPYKDELFIQFHNCNDPEGLMDLWRAYLPTAVGFRDFVAYVFNENYDWIHREEIRYKKLCEEQEWKFRKNIKIPKIEELFASYPKKQIPETVQNDSYSSIGYNLGNYRVQITGNTWFYANDHLNVRLEKSKWVTGKELLSVMIRKNSNELYLHTYPENDVEKCRIDNFTFHVHLSNDMLMAFSKPSGALQRQKQKDFKSLLINRQNYTKTTVSKIRPKFDEIVTEHEVRLPNLNQCEPFTVCESNSPSKDDSGDEICKYLTSDDKFSSNSIEEQKFLKLKNKVLSIISQAKQNFRPHYKIYSSKLHQHRYIKLENLRVQLFKGKIQKNLIVKPPASLLKGYHRTPKTKLHSKWIRLSTNSVDSEQSKNPLDFDFCCSWPNGMQIKTVTTGDQMDPFYIKQQYLCKNSPVLDRIKDELSRCFLRNGTILIFKTGGHLSILCPDTHVYHCQIDGFKPTTLKPNSQKLRNSSEYRFRKHLIASSSRLGMSYYQKFYLRRHKIDYKIAIEQSKRVPHLIPIPEFTVSTPGPNSSTITVRNNVKCLAPTPLLVSVANCLEEIYFEREDGVTCILSSDGTLITSFADETRIKLTCSIEQDEIILQLSEAEYEELLERLLLERSEILKQIETGEEEELYNFDFLDEEFSQIIFEGFISVVINCTFESPYYATVNYNGSDLSCNLKMPKGTSVTVTKNGNYMAQLDDKTELTVNSNSVIFSQIACCHIDRTDCTIDITPFIGIATQFPFAYIVETDSTRTFYSIDYQGNPIPPSKIPEQIPTSVPTNHQSIRYLVLDRNLRGIDFVSDLRKEQFLAKRAGHKYLAVRSDDDSVEESVEDNTASLTVTMDIPNNHSESWLPPYVSVKFVPPHFLKPYSSFPDGWIARYSNKVKKFARFSGASTQIGINSDCSVMMDRRFVKIHKDLIEDVIHPFVEIAAEANFVQGVPKTISAESFKERWYRNKTLYLNQNEEEYYKELLSKPEIAKPNCSPNKNVRSIINETVIPEIKSDQTHLDTVKSEISQEAALVEIVKKWAEGGFPLPSNFTRNKCKEINIMDF